MRLINNVTENLAPRARLRGEELGGRERFTRVSGRSIRQQVLGLLLLNFAACSPASPTPTLINVGGNVHVGGKPAAGVALTLVPELGPAVSPPIANSAGSISTAITDVDGRFEISTYSAADGVPPGNYAVTFVWSEYNPLSRSRTGDKLNGRYASPEKTPIHWSLGEQNPVDVGTIELIPATK